MKTVQACEFKYFDENKLFLFKRQQILKLRLMAAFSKIIQSQFMRVSVCKKEALNDVSCCN